MALPTPAEVRAHLEGFNITASVSSDAFITDERDNNVVPFVEGFIGASVSVVRTITEYLSGTGTTRLILNNRLATAIVSIVIVRGEDFIGNLSLNSFDLIPGEGIVKAKTNISEGMYFTLFPKGESNLKVTYTIGGTLPADLAHAIKKLTCIKVLQNIEGRTGGGELSTQGFSRNYGNLGKYSNIRKQFNNEAMNILRRYSTAVVGS